MFHGVNVPNQCRLTDLAVGISAHGCPKCPHAVTGPCVAASPNVEAEGLAAMRVGDPGVHAMCCGPNIWAAAMGSGTVLINNMNAVRVGDMTAHCGGVGTMTTGAGTVLTGP